MRTFAHFPTDDREHRLIYDEMPTPEPTQAETPTPQPESVEPTETLNTSDAATDTAAAEVDTAAADTAAMEEPIDEVDQIMNENPDVGEIEAQPDVQNAQIDLNAALSGTADFVEQTGTTVKQGADQIGGFLRGLRGSGETQTPVPPSDSEAPVNLEDQPIEPEFAEEDEDPFMRSPEGDGPVSPDDQPIEPEFAEEETPADAEVPTETETPEDPTSVDPTKISNEEEQGLPPAGTEGATTDTPADAEVPTEKETPAAEGEKPTPESGEKKEKTTESKESPEKSYEKEKVQQRLGQETDKLSDVRKGNPDKWSSINNGKTDGTGKPFLYKEGKNDKGEKVLLAYSPNTGVQVMNVSTGEWKLMNKMIPAEQAKIEGADGMGAKEHADAVAAERKSDPDGFAKRMEQNARNFSMEEKCLKNIAADPQWFAKNMENPMWKGNEDIRDALAAALKDPDAKTTDAPAAEGTEKPAEDKEANPEIAELKKLIEEMKKKLDEMSDRLGKLEGKDGEKKEEGKEDGKEGDETDEDAEKNEDLSEAERAEKNKKETDEALDALDGKTEEKKDDADTDTDDKDADKVEKREAAKESTETDKELRSRLISQVRGDPKKSVADVKGEKEATFGTIKEQLDAQIDNSDGNIRVQSQKVDGIKGEVADLQQKLAAAPEDEQDEIQKDITKAEAKLATEQENLRTMEQNRDTFVKDLQTARDQMATDVKMLDTLETEWNTTAEKTETKFEEMGTKLISLGDSATGKIVQGLDVKHDGSFGLTMTGADTLAETLKPFLETTDIEDLTKNDHPAPALRGVAGLIKSLEAKAGAKPATEAPPAEPEATTQASIRPSQNFQRDRGAV